MKKLAIFSYIIAFFAIENVQAQVSTGNIVKRLVTICAYLENENDQILFMQVDVLKNNQNAVMNYDLNAGDSYIIIAIGDEERISDIDLVVSDENRNIIESDKDAANVAIARVTPRWSGKFYMKISPYKMSYGASDGFYALLIVRDN